MELSSVMRKPTIVRCWADVDTVCERVRGEPNPIGSRSLKGFVTEQDVQTSYHSGHIHRHQSGGPSQRQDDGIAIQDVTEKLSQRPNELKGDVRWCRLAPHGGARRSQRPNELKGDVRLAVLRSCTWSPVSQRPNELKGDVSDSIANGGVSVTTPRNAQTN